jgi:hypothetical protein
VHGPIIGRDNDDNAPSARSFRGKKNRDEIATSRGRDDCGELS